MSHQVHLVPTRSDTAGTLLGVCSSLHTGTTAAAVRTLVGHLCCKAECPSRLSSSSRLPADLTVELSLSHCSSSSSSSAAAGTLVAAASLLQTCALPSTTQLQLNKYKLIQMQIQNWYKYKYKYNYKYHTTHAHAKIVIDTKHCLVNRVLNQSSTGAGACIPQILILNIPQISILLLFPGSINIEQEHCFGETIFSPNIRYAVLYPSWK